MIVVCVCVCVCVFVCVCVCVLVKGYTKLTKRSLALAGPSDNELLTGILDELKANK